MFSFHKPKVYRSTAGCCICKAKSSSSRFTDSKKYETDFIQCFQLDNPRRGEICNACVLLVKRFKRLPPGSNRHWGHVVDARTGPGLKSMTKFKKRKEEQEGKDSNYVSKIFKKNKKKTFKKETSSLGGSSDDSPPSPTESQISDDYDDGIFEKKYYSYSTRAQQLKRDEAALKKKIKRKNPHPTKVSRWPANHFNLLSDVVSDDQWRQRITCCGAIYECEALRAVIINVASFKPCSKHKNTTLVANEALSTLTSAAYSPSSASAVIVAPQILKTSITSTTITSMETTPTAIKKHQLFLKRHSEPSSVTKSCDISSSNVTEFNMNEKTEPMDSMTKIAMEKDKNGHGKMEVDGISMLANESAYDQKELMTSKLLQELAQETSKINKPSSLLINPLSSVNGLLKYKLANMARFGVIGNDNSSDSGYGYEEVQDGNKLITIAQMPPPADVLQSL